VLECIETCRIIAEREVNPIFALDNEGRVTYANPAAEKLFGYTAQEFAGKILHDMVHHHHRDGTLFPRGECPIFLACIRGQAIDNHVTAMIRNDGSFVGISCSGFPKAKGSVLLLRDMTEIDHLHSVSEALRKSQETLRLATEAAHLGLWDFYPQVGTLVWNETKKSLFGIPPDENVTYDAFVEMIDPDDRDRMAATLKSAMTHGGDGRLEIEFRAVRLNDGEQRWFKSHGKALWDPAGRPARVIGATLDITDTKFAEQRIREASQHDALTGLPNRATLFEYCSHLLAMAKRTGNSMALLFIDLDRFKPINDTHGHDIGDQVLRQVARRLAGCVRQEDIVGRLGGDEFLVAIRDPDDVRTPATVAQHIIKIISEPYHVGHLQLHLSPSIGISLFPQHAATLDVLIQYADTAMYAAKRGGRKRYKFYTPTEGGAGAQHVSIEMRLKYALENNELVLHYQPMLELESNRVIGVEALLRLPVPDGVPLVPNQFLSIAEAAGLLNRLGEWVAQEACRQHTQWREAGLPGLIMAINVSSQQVQQPSFAAHLANSLLHTSMDPGCLQIELNESAVIEHVREIQAALEEVRSIGIGVALDNFGTGFSSVGLLSSLPLDKLKIDQSLVGQIGHDVKSQTITASILALGRSLKLKVVGGGIESEASFDYLREQGCDQAQGYYFSKPLSPDEFERWYKNTQLRDGMVH
jgi:diguanylate cyclase (GGDEF)-like protein/PAS domain S-box-containing protein